MVQRMAPIASGKQKKYEPERTRDFVNFSDFSSLTLANVKLACEKFYGEEEGSCDVLFSDRGPSCIEDEQIAGKKVILIRFIQSTIKKPSITNATNNNNTMADSVAAVRSLTTKPSRIFNFQTQA